MCELFRRLRFFLTHLLLVGGAGFLQDMFDLGDRDNREEFGEEEITGEEKSECAHIKPDLEDRGPVVRGPAAGYIVPVDGGHDDHEAFEPHPDIHDNRHKKGYGQVAAHLAEPEDLRGEHVTTHHNIVTPAQGTKDIDAVLEEGPAFEFILPVPGDEQLRQVGDTYDGAGEHDHLIHYVDVFEGYIFL